MEIEQFYSALCVRVSEIDEKKKRKTRKPEYPTVPRIQISNKNIN